MPFVIAIDGPSSAGKSTAANLVSSELKIPHIQGGAIYRCIGLQMLKENIKVEDEEKIIKLLSDNFNFKFKRINGKQRIFLNLEDVTEIIRTTQVTDYTSKVASVRLVRDMVNKMVRRYAKDNSIVIDGRDSGTEVFPDADVKFFLNASPIARAKRKQYELSQIGENVSLNDILKSIYTWDYDAVHREYGALKRAPDSIYIDTSTLEIDEVKEIMLKNIKEKITEKTIFFKDEER